MSQFRHSGPVESVDAMFAALAHPARRTFLRFIYEKHGPVSREAAIDAVREQLGDLDTSRLETAFVHVHLPKLKDAGMVATDETGERLVLTDREYLSPALQLLDVYR